MADEPPDPELIKAAARGDRATGERLLERCLPPILGWCHRLGGPLVDPEDAAQDIALTALRRLSTLQDPTRFWSWLFGATRRVLRDHRQSAWSRKRSDREVPDCPALGVTGPYEQVDARRRVRTALEDLGDPEREVLVLCLLEERTQEEAAELIGVPRGTVASRLKRARQRFEEVARARRLDELLEAEGGNS